MKKQFRKLVDISESKATFLFRFNLFAGILHAIQGIIILFLSNDTMRTVSHTLPNPDYASRSVELINERLFEVRLGPAIALFLFISAISHFILISPGIHQWYLKNLSMKMNLARWYEYALSSSVMISVVAILSGVTDVWMLLLIFILNACMNLFGLSMEKHNAKMEQMMGDDVTIDWTEYIFGVIAGFAPWIIIGIYFIISLNRLDGQVVVPNYVRIVFWSLVFTFNTFAINMFLQYKKIGPWKDFLFGEKMFIVLSLVAKTIITWQVYLGTLR